MPALGCQAILAFLDSAATLGNLATAVILDQVYLVIVVQEHRDTLDLAGTHGRNRIYGPPNKQFNGVRRRIQNYNIGSYRRYLVFKL